MPGMRAAAPLLLALPLLLAGCGDTASDAAPKVPDTTAAPEAPDGKLGGGKVVSGAETCACPAGSTWSGAHPVGAICVNADKDPVGGQFDSALMADLEAGLKTEETCTAVTGNKWVPYSCDDAYTKDQICAETEADAYEMFGCCAKPDAATVSGEGECGCAPGKTWAGTTTFGHLCTHSNGKTIMGMAYEGTAMAAHEAGLKVEADCTAGGHTWKSFSCAEAYTDDKTCKKVKPSTYDNVGCCSGIATKVSGAGTCACGTEKTWDGDLRVGHICFHTAMNMAIGLAYDVAALADWQQGVTTEAACTTAGGMWIPFDCDSTYSDDPTCSEADADGYVAFGCCA